MQTLLSTAAEDQTSNIGIRPLLYHSQLKQPTLLHVLVFFFAYTVRNMCSSISVLTREELENDQANKKESQLIIAILAQQAAKLESDRGVREAHQAAFMQQKQLDQRIEVHRARLQSIREKAAPPAGVEPDPQLPKKTVWLIDQLR